MNITFLREAQLEFVQTSSYYDQVLTGLGDRFSEEVDRSINWIAQHPEVCKLRRQGYRRFNIRTFPYYLPYIVRESHIWILAVAHNSRKPVYWLERQKDVG